MSNRLRNDQKIIKASICARACSLAPSVQMAVMSLILLGAALADPDLQIVTNEVNSCLNYEHQVACWGVGIYGTLGRGDTANFGGQASDLEVELFPIDLGEDFRVKSIFGGGYAHNCALSFENLLKYAILYPLAFHFHIHCAFLIKVLGSR